MIEVAEQRGGNQAVFAFAPAIVGHSAMPPG
jgi:hypothetical protein